MTAAHPARLVEPSTGLIAEAAFNDESVYTAEQHAVFQQSWLFLCHESSLSGPDTFLSTTMGEDPIVLWRAKDGRLRAFLNTCPHRGNGLCVYDQGAAPVLRCSYHGWTFDAEGNLVGVPFERRAYTGGLDRRSNGLAAVPRVESYGGLVFGCWDPDAVSLEAYLGDLRPWLDAFLCFDDLGGLTVLHGCQRYITAGNWKVCCDEFASGIYDLVASRGSVVKPAGEQSPTAERGPFMTFFEPAHSLGGIFTDVSRYEQDLERAAHIGRDAVQYVRERWSLLQRRLGAWAGKASQVSFGLVFPNFFLRSIGEVLGGNVLGVCHPRGMHQCEVRKWVLVERDAPEEIKRAAAQSASRGQPALRFAASDGAERVENVERSIRPPEGMEVKDLPPLVGPQLWRVGHARFYQHWMNLMGIRVGP